MKNLDVKELRKKSRFDLLKDLNDISKEQVKLKIFQSEENNNKNHIFGVMRKNISKILTILGEKDEKSRL